MIGPFKGKYRFLSNFYYSEILSPSLEHHYQAAKTTDLQLQKWVLSSTSAYIAKRRGRQIPIRKDWEQIKLSVMKDLVRKKFEDPKLRNLLIETGDEELVELNYWGDDFWGVDLHTNVGENHLGRILMEVREEIRNVLS